MKNALNKKMVLLLAMVAMVTVGAFAEDGRSIVQKSLDVKRPKFTRSVVTMTLIDANGAKEVRKIHEMAKDNQDDTGAAVIIFRSPASIKDTRFLQIVNKNKANDKWIYLPALRKVRRIAGAAGSQSFVGTDATYDDLETRKIDQDKHKLLGNAKVGSYNCWKIESISVDPKDSQYSKKVSYIDKKTFVPVKAEMYDKKGKLLKVLMVLKLEKKNGYWIPMKTSLKNVQTNHSTEMDINKIEIDKAIKDKYFTQNFIQTGRI